jgi:hypothetical protein
MLLSQHCTKTQRVFAKWKQNLPNKLSRGRKELLWQVTLIYNLLRGYAEVSPFAKLITDLMALDFQAAAAQQDEAQIRARFAC